MRLNRGFISPHAPGGSGVEKPCYRSPRQAPSTAKHTSGTIGRTRSIASEMWQEIAARKRKARDALIPQEWRIPKDVIPQDPPTLAYGYQNVMSIPRECGMLSSQEIKMTEGYSVKSLLSSLARSRLTAVDVVTAFCKRAAIAQQVTNCLTEPMFEAATKRALELDAHLRESGKVIGPLHGLPIRPRSVSLNVLTGITPAGYSRSVQLDV